MVSSLTTPWYSFRSQVSGKKVFSSIFVPQKNRLWRNFRAPRLWQTNIYLKVGESDFWVTLPKSTLKYSFTDPAVLHFHPIYKRGNVKFEKKVEKVKREI